MPDLDIDDVHRMLDELEKAQAELEDFKGERIEVVQLIDVCTIVQELTDVDMNRSLMQPMFGISPSILNPFIHMRGRVKTQDARRVIDRLRADT